MKFKRSPKCIVKLLEKYYPSETNLTLFKITDYKNFEAVVLDRKPEIDRSIYKVLFIFDNEGHPMNHIIVKNIDAKFIRPTNNWINLRKITYLFNKSLELNT